VGFDSRLVGLKVEVVFYWVERLKREALIVLKKACIIKSYFYSVFER
jgi:hypothetical protein